MIRCSSPGSTAREGAVLTASTLPRCILEDRHHYPARSARAMRL
jgi:hypothetical protein